MRSRWGGVDKFVLVYAYIGTKGIAQAKSKRNKKEQRKNIRRFIGAEKR